MRETAGIVRRDDLVQLRVWGRDPVRMLNGLITNDLGLLGPDRAVYAAMLTPKGRVIADLRAFRARSLAEAEVVVDLAASAVGRVGEHLKKYVPPLFARWEPVTDRFGMIGVFGPRAPELVARVLGLEPNPAEDRITAGSFDSRPVEAVATRVAGGEPGFDLFASADDLHGLWGELISSGTELGARAAGIAALETARIEGGRPRFAAELGEEVLPAEAFETTGLMERALSFSKGCYTGQEVVIRIAHRGHVNRHLRGLLLGETAEPATGTPLYAPESGKEVGRTTSATHSPLMKQTIALGYLRREINPGAGVHLGTPDGPLARVTELPFAA